MDVLLSLLTGILIYALGLIGLGVICKICWLVFMLGWSMI